MTVGLVGRPPEAVEDDVCRTDWALQPTLRSLVGQTGRSKRRDLLAGLDRRRLLRTVLDAKNASLGDARGGVCRDGDEEWCDEYEQSATFGSAGRRPCSKVAKRINCRLSLWRRASRSAGKGSESGPSIGEVRPDLTQARARKQSAPTAHNEQSNPNLRQTNPVEVLPVDRLLLLNTLAAQR